MVSIVVIVGLVRSLGQKISPDPLFTGVSSASRPWLSFHGVKDETIPIVRTFSKRLRSGAGG